MEYVNKGNNPLELVIDLLLSLESAALIEDFTYNVETICIHEENEPDHQEAEDYLMVNSKNLNELAAVKYLAREEFNDLVINRFCEGLKSYIEEDSRLRNYTLRLRLADYSQMVCSEIKGIELVKLFQEEKDNVTDKYQEIKIKLLMDKQLSNTSEIDYRQEALKSLCESLYEETTKKQSITGENIYRHLSEEETLNTDKDYNNNPESLHFINVPQHLVTPSEANKRLYPKLKTDSKDYNTYIKPLTVDPNPPEEPYILSKGQLDSYFDRFNELEIFREYSRYSDYMGLLETYASAHENDRDTFRKRFDIKKIDIVNKHSAKSIHESRKQNSDVAFTHSHGLIAHCYWMIYQDAAVFNLQTKARAENNITDYLDTLIRYYIFIEKKLLGEVLPIFASYYDSEYNDKLKELREAEIDKNNPAQDNRAQSSKDTKYQRLVKEVKGYSASENDIIQYGTDVIKIHFNHDILEYVIKTYLHAQKKHHDIIKKYTQK